VGGDARPRAAAGHTLKPREVALIRTQIYLSVEADRELRALSRRTGQSRSELIRRAVDRLLAGTGEQDRAALLRQARGLWRYRHDLPDFESLRRELTSPPASR
jgi:hypothetical protein